MVDGVNRSGGAYIPQGVETGNESKAAQHTKQANEIRFSPSDMKTLSVAGGNEIENALLQPKGDGKDLKAQQFQGQLNVPSDTVSADIFTFMALFQKIAQEMRNSNREVRTQELQGQISELHNAASEMRSAAEKRFAAAVVQSSLQLAGGIVQTGMSSASMVSSVKGAQASAQAEKTGSLAKTLKNTPDNVELRNELRGSAADLSAKGRVLEARGQSLNQLGQGVSQSLGGVGGIASAALTMEADKMDASRAEAEARSKEHEINVQHANEMMQQMMDVIRDVRDKLASITQASIETNRGIARNI